jgi:hypothetical protein
MSAKGMDAEVGRAKRAASVLRCLAAPDAIAFDNEATLGARVALTSSDKCGFTEARRQVLCRRRATPDAPERCLPDDVRSTDGLAIARFAKVLARG